MTRKIPRINKDATDGTATLVGGGSRWDPKPIHVGELGTVTASLTLVLIQCLSHGEDKSDVDILLNRNMSIRVQKILKFSWMLVKRPFHGGTVSQGNHGPFLILSFLRPSGFKRKTKIIDYSQLIFLSMWVYIFIEIGHESRLGQRVPCRLWLISFCYMNSGN